LLRDVRLRALADAPHAFASSYADEAARPQEAWDADATTRSDGHESTIYILVSEHGVVGLVGAYRSTQEPGTVELVSMWVSPDARGHGLGARLIDEVMEWARESGARRVALWVMRENDEAIALYRRAGFVETGISEAAATHPCRGELRMAHELGVS
jgi:ribosomal protein S18 acetylase RimI-like enzyme